jgi:CubicO group peptidase (beta-lactamase class C family)
MQRRLKPLVGIALLSLSISGGANGADSTNGADSASRAASAAAQYSAADEALYRERFQKLQDSFVTGLGLEEYDPLEPVPGDPAYRPLPIKPPQARSIEETALTRARDYAASNRSTSLLVWRGDGLEHVSHFGATTADQLQASRSLAKPMTAIAVGRAIALGKIRSLDQPVADFITEWRGLPRQSTLRVRHLLDMRSGMLPQSPETGIEHILNRAYLHPRHDDILINEYPFVDEPGTRYEYSNATSELVALLIERATDMRYAQFLSQHVLQPIGASGGTIWVNRQNGLAHSGCCLMLTAESWIRLGVLLMNDGRWEGRRLLPSGYVRDMTRGTTENPYYGLGVYVAGDYTPRRGFLNGAREPDARRVLHGEPYLARDLFMFDGNSNQVLYIVPSARLVVLRLGAQPPRSPNGEWDNAVLPNVLLRGIRHRAGERRPTPQPGPIRPPASP